MKEKVKEESRRNTYVFQGFLTQNFFFRTSRKIQDLVGGAISVRKNKIKPLLDQIYDIIGTLRPSKNSHLYTVVTYARNQKEELYYFLDDPNVEMTNNLAEQTVKNYVIR